MIHASQNQLTLSTLSTIHSAKTENKKEFRLWNFNDNPKTWSSYWSSKANTRSSKNFRCNPSVSGMYLKRHIPHWYQSLSVCFLEMHYLYMVWLMTNVSIFSVSGHFFVIFKCNCAIYFISISVQPCTHRNRQFFFSETAYSDMVIFRSSGWTCLHVKFTANDVWLFRNCQYILIPKCHNDILTVFRFVWSALYIYIYIFYACILTNPKWKSEAIVIHPFLVSVTMRFF